jgi:hypothetical protein
MHLCDGLRLIGNMVEHVHGDDGIEARVREGQGDGIGLDAGHGPLPQRVAAIECLAHHTGRLIRQRQVEPLGQHWRYRLKEPARSAADIEHLVAFAKAQPLRDELEPALFRDAVLRVKAGAGRELFARAVLRRHA